MCTGPHQLPHNPYARSRHPERKMLINPPLAGRIMEETPLHQVPIPQSAHHPNDPDLKM